MAELLRQHLETENRKGIKEQVKEVEAVKKAITLNQQKTDRLLESFLNQLTPENIYKAKMTELQEEKLRLESRQAEVKINDEDFAVSLEEVLYLTQHAEEILKSSKLDGKRQLINCVLSNLVLKEKKVEFTYRKPFDLFAKGFFSSETCAQQESNLYPQLRRLVLYPLSYGRGN